MGKAKKVGIIAGVVIAGFFVAMIGIGAYLVSTNPNLAQQVSSTGDEMQATAILSPNADKVVGISEFSMSKQGSLYQVWFQLTDRDVNPVIANANVHLEVSTIHMNYNTQTQQVEETPTTVYEQSFAVKEEEYQDYVRKLTGADTGQMYLWLVDAQEIDSKVGSSVSAFGKAMITVTLENGKSYTAETSIFF